MPAEPHVVIIAGGSSHEREVSQRSGRRIADALRHTGAHVETIDVETGMLEHLRDSKPDLVWPTLHGVMGEDGTIADLLNLLRLPYIGSKPRSAALSWNKSLAKNAVEAAGVAVLPDVVLPKSSFRELGATAILGALTSAMPLPLSVKPVMAGSSQGFTLVTSDLELTPAMVTCFGYGEAALIEPAVSGTEISVGVLDLGDGPATLPAVEIEAVGGSYDYDARYTAGASRFHIPARVSRETLSTVALAALAAFRALDLRHIARIDFIVDTDGRAWFLEADTAPGMTETSILPRAILQNSEPASSPTQVLAPVYRQLVDTVLATSVRS
ncbi:D-alanine--D-alanine ligase [Saxibacter everestensis]|uniref:D-alanine--D-alanine ligase n=1 Tax=Saxibacter everestensis TaxID=2909229 RepID=A0ABY8QTU0_9MICO|nr:D-alanine--D-alanine ligase [Brevibacteriaceae bacterium ZFBP1038]